MLLNRNSCGKPPTFGAAGGVDRSTATSVVVPGISGSMGFLNNHAPLITVLKAGDVKVTTANGEEIYAVKGGVVEVSNNTVIVLAE